MNVLPARTKAHFVDQPNRISVPVEINALLNAAATAEGMPVEWAFDHAQFHGVQKS